MNVRIRHDMHFGAAVYYAGQFKVNHYKLGLCITTNDPDPIQQNIALERIKYFVYQELDSTVFISVDDMDQIVSYASAGLNITSLPCQPVDQIVGIMLYYKLNAIMEQRLFVTETELSSVLGDNIVYLHNDNEDAMDLNNQSDWWTSADLVHFDRDILDQDKVLTMPQANAWRDLGLAWNNHDSEEDSGNVVVFADFKNNETK